MSEGLTLARERPGELGLDQPQLYALGLQRVRALARTVWTDHNVHDPGITTLELLAYALTDLSYRASLPIEDLLAGRDAFKDLSAATVLPNRPWTTLDYRKLMIDVPGVRNAWLAPVPVTRFADGVTGEILVKKPNRPGITDVELHGIYQPRIELDDDALPAAAEKKLRSEVLKQLHAHRNLCEDFLAVTVVERQGFRLCGELELHADADPVTVHLAILQQVQSYLAPGVTRYTRDQMLSRRREDGALNTPADFFDGPRLEHGFIDDDELAASDLRTSIRLSDIISIVMDVPGVKAVRELLIGPEPEDATKPPVPIANKWVLAVAQGKQPRLDTQKCRIVYYKGHIPTVAPVVAALPAPAPSSITSEDVPIPAGRVRRVADYASFQLHFPEIYGVGESPLPETASVRRRALAAQLKAYLLFFDQVMANYCAQLTHVADLFAIASADTPTYFAQLVGTSPDLKRMSPDLLAIYGLVKGAAETEDQFKTRVAQKAQDVSAGLESPGDRIARRNRFLDHLIARFAERFHDYVQIMRSAFGASGVSLLEDKRAFLEAWPSVARDRGHAFNHALKDAAELWDTADNISGLEQRVTRLLGIGDRRRRDLTTVTPGADATVTAGPGNNGFVYALVDRNDPGGSTLLQSEAMSNTAVLARAQMLRAFELGQWQSTYFPGVTGAKHFFIIQDKDGTKVGRSPDFNNVADRDAAIVALRTYLRRHYSREGFYVIENILMRPESQSDPSLRFCLDPGCDDCGGDPYSYQIHVILPAFAGRFNDMDFRRFVEDTIREEAPAHILPKICWVDEEDMGKVQTAYRAWLEGRTGGTVAERADRLKKLVDVLSNVKSVYPVQKLIACGDASKNVKFIVGRTALGTKQDND